MANTKIERNRVVGCVIPTTANAKVSVLAVSTLVLAANMDRIGATFVNDSDTVIYLSKGGAAVLNQGIRLNANGGSYEIGQSNLFVGAVYAISAVAAKNLCVTED